MSIPKYIYGDKVLYYDEIKTIKENLAMHIGTSYTVLDSEGKEDCVKEEELEGVPLTPQILEANGWKEVPLVKGLYVRRQGITIFKNSNGKGFLAQYEIGITVHFAFVHQLQHLLFGLGLNSELKV